MAGAVSGVEVSELLSETGITTITLVHVIQRTTEAWPAQLGRERYCVGMMGDH